MKNNITELVFVLDRSGSMHGLEQDTVGGFNALIEKQKTVEGKCFVTTVLFNGEMRTVHDRLELAEIPPMTEKDYQPGGCTALLDALGDTIRHIARIHKYARPEDVPEHTLFVIMTDGLENASHRYTGDEVRRLVEHEKEKYGWEFLFLAANIDAAEAAGRCGIAPDRTANYHADAEGTDVVYKAVAETVCHARMGAPIDAGWNDKINRDYRGRKSDPRRGKTAK